MPKLNGTDIGTVDINPDNRWPLIGLPFLVFRLQLNDKGPGHASDRALFLVWQQPHRPTLSEPDRGGKVAEALF